MAGLITADPAVLSVTAPDGTTATAIIADGPNLTTTVQSNTATFTGGIGKTITAVMVGEGEFFDGDSTGTTHKARWLGTPGRSASEIYAALADGSVTAPIIAAGAVLTEHLAVGVLKRNLVNDPSFEEEYEFTAFDPFGTGQGDVNQWRSHLTDNIPVRSTVTGRSRSGSKAMELTVAGGGGVASAISNTFPVKVGQEYRLIVNAASLTAEAEMSLNVQEAATQDGIDGFHAVTLTGDSTWALHPTLSAEPVAASAFDSYSWSFTPTLDYCAVRVYNIAAGSTMLVDDVSVVQTGVGGASELTPAGLRLFDENGFEATSLVTNRSNYFSIMDQGATIASIDESGTASLQSLSVVNEPEIMGQVLLGNTSTYESPVASDNIVGWLDALPRGVQAYGSQAGGTTYSTRRGIFELAWSAYPGRTYRINWSGCHATVTGANITTGFQINHVGPSTVGGEAPSPNLSNSNPIMFSQVTVGASPRAVTFPGSSQIMRCNISGDTADGGELKAGINKVLLVVTGDLASILPTTVYGSAMNIVVEDIGPDAPVSDVNNASTDSVPVSATVKKSYVKTYASNGWAMYQSSGARKTNAYDVKQGYSSYDGDARGLWTFPTTIQSDLNGAVSISRIRVYLYANHWYYNSGGTALIKVHGHASIPSTLGGSSPMTSAVSSANWPKPGGRWVTLPSSLYPGFQNGTYKGIGVGPANTTNLLYYGRFNPTGVKIEVTYVK